MNRSYMKGILLLAVSTVLFLSGCSGTGSEQGAATSKKQVYSGISGSAFQVTSGTDNEEQPAVAYDRVNKKYLSVWTDYRNGNADVYGKLCDASTSGAGLQATPPVCGADFMVAGGAGSQWQPKVAFDYASATPKYLIVMADTSPGYSIIRGQFVRADGRLLKQDGSTVTATVVTPELFDISTHIATADPSQIEPDVVFNDFAGKFTVGWLGTSNYDTYDYPAATTTTYTTQPTFSSGDLKYVATANAIIDVKFSNGNPVTNYSVSPANPDVSNQASTVTLGSGSNAIGTSSNLVIRYADSSKASTDGSTTKALAATWAANDSFAVTVGATSLGYVYLFIDSLHVFSATNTQQVVSGSDVYVGVLSGSNLISLTTAYWTAFQIGTITWTAPAWAAGSTIVVSDVYSGANTSPYSVTLVDGNGVSRTTDFDIVVTGNTLIATLKNNGNSLVGTNPSVTVTYRPVKNLYGPVQGKGCINSYGPIPYAPVNHVGTSLAAYADVSLGGVVGTPVPYSQMVAISATDDGSTIVVKWNVSENESKPKLSYNPLDGESFMVWSGTQHDETLNIGYTKDSFNVCTYGHVFVRGTDTTQKIILRRWINNLATDYLLGNSAFYPAISIDPTAKRLLVAWEEQNSASVATTGKDISAQLIDLTNFVLYGKSITVSSAVGDQTSPAAAYDSVNQRHMIVWEDARNQSANISNIDIYGQFIDPQGNLSGGNVPINVNEGNQLAPTLAFGDVSFRQFLIIWKDAIDPANANLWGQLLQYSTLPQLVIADSTGSPILNGALDFGSVAVGQYKDLVINLRNDGNMTLTVSSMSTPDDPFTFVTPKPVTVSPGTSYPMTIRFSPTAAGSYTGNPTNGFKTDLKSNGGNTTLYFSGSGVGINPLSITTTGLPDAGTSGSYFYHVEAAGGVYPYSWSASGLPAALSINSTTGDITGNNPASGAYTVTITVSDSNSPAATASRTFTMNVGAISITTTSLSSWTQGVDYVSSPAHTLAASGGTLPLTWSIASGSLPPGITLAPATGILSGAATSSGVYTFTAKVTDSAGTPQTAQATLSITINPQPTILTSSLTNGVVGLTYSQTLTMTGGTLPVTWTLSGSTPLPPGLTFNTGTGVITGTPTTSGTKSLDFTVTDAAGATGTKTLTIAVNSALDISTPTSGVGAPSAALIGSSYSFTFSTNNGGIAPYSWSVVSGAVPLGLVFNKDTGVLSGTPTVEGSYTFIAQVQDFNGTTVQKTYTINASQPVVITTAGLPAWTVNSTTAYSQALAATGGNGVYTWSLTSGVLPAGLSLAAGTGVISGTPTASGVFPITVKATDGNGLSASKQFTLQINQPLVITTTLLAGGVVNTAYTPQTLLSVGGTGAVTWAVTAGSLPTGLYLDGITGSISGLVTASAGTYSFTVSATDSGGKTASANLSIVVSAAPATLTITTSVVSDMVVGVPVSITLLHDGSTSSGTYSWAVSGNLPPGVSLTSPGGGTLAGVPSAAGDYQFDVFVTDGTQTATRHFSVSVRQLLTINASALKSWEKDLVGYVDTLSATGGRGPYKWSVIANSVESPSPWSAASVALNDSTGNPTGLVLNTATGVISGTPTAAAGVYTFTFKVLDAAPTPEAVTKQLTLVISSPMVISVTPPTIYSGTSTSFAMSVAGGTAPKTWSVSGGVLPTGLALNTNTGIISGTPTTAGTYSSIITVTDYNGRTASSPQSFTVNAPVSITSTTIPSWTVGTAYQPGGSTFALATSGGVAPLAYTVSAGALPAGLSLGGANGQISGTPSTSGNYTFTITVTDSGTLPNQSSASKQFTMSINPAMVMTTTAVAHGTVGSIYSQPLTLSGGTAPYTWTASNLPAGLVMDSLTGAITGIPTAAFSGNVTVTIRDAAGTTVSPTLPMQIHGVLAITDPGAQTAVSGSPYSLTLSTGTTGNGPFTWSAAGLPAGVSIGNGTGIIGGTPLSAGTFDAVISVTDADGRSATRALRFTVNASVVVTTSSLSAWTQGKAGYSQTLATSGGTGAITWAVTSGSLPPGLALAAGTGVISDTGAGPTLAGSYTFSVRASDAGTGTTNSKQLTIVVNPPVVIATTALADGTSGYFYSQQLLANGGTTPLLWSLANATALPQGLSLDSLTGVISGTPTGTVGTTTFDIMTIDASGASNVKAGLTILVNGTPSSLQIDAATSIPTTVRVGDVFSPVSLIASGGSKPYSWSLVAGALPTGLTLNSSGGTISGTPTTAGVYNVVLRVTDSTIRNADKLYSITVTSPLTISTATLKAGSTGVVYADTLNGSGGIAPYTWSLKSGSSLPTGLSLAAGTGAITGTPTGSGTTQFAVLLTDSFGTTIEKQLQISVSNPLTISTTAISSFTVNPKATTTPQSFTLAVTGGAGAPYTWTSTSIPDGLTLSSSGILSGFPSTPGSISVVFSVTDAGGNVATKQLVVTVASPVQISTTQVKAWTQGVNGYSQQLTAVGGSPIGGVPGQYTWSWAGSWDTNFVNRDDLPPGLSLNSSTGVITGSPSAARASAYAFDVTAMDSNGVYITRTYYLQVNPAITLQTTNLSSGTENILYNAQLQMTGGTAPFTWSTSSGTLPSGLTLDPLSGLITGVPAAGTNGSYPVTFRVTDATGAFVDKPLNLTIAATLQVSSSSLPTVLFGNPYDQTLAATGGSAPYKWSVVTGSLPTGLTLNADTGKISGTPSVSGRFDFVVQVADAGSRTDIKNLSITVLAPLSFSSPTSLTPWTVGKAGYSYQLAAIGGSGSYSWAVTAGALPSGMSLALGTGIVSGTPSQAGTFAFTVKATDTTDATIIGSKQFTMVVNPALTITTIALGPGTVGAYYNQPLLYTGGTGPVIWTLKSGTLPAGLTLDSLAGLISGIPTVAGTASNLVFTVTDAAGVAVDTAALSIVTSGTLSAFSITTASISDMKTGTAVGFSLTASGGTQPYTWSVIGGAFPSGVSLNAGGGGVSGTPNQAGNYSVVVAVTDSSPTPQTVTKLYSFAVRDPLLITTTTLKSGNSGLGYQDTLTGTGGNGGYTWSASGLPAGLSITPGTGSISGTPTANGTYTVTVTLTDVSGTSVNKDFTIQISSAMTISTTPAVVPSMTVGSLSSFQLNVVGGADPKTWSSSTLPTGLTLSGNTVSGTPTTPGSSSVVFTVTDSTGRSQSSTVTVSVANPISISNSSLKSWTANQAGYSETLVSTGGNGAITWSVSSGALPTGISLVGNTLSGTPTSVGTSTINFTATDVDGRTSTKQLTITVNQPLSIMTSSAATGTVGTLYSQTVSLLGGTSPAIWSVTGLETSGLFIDSLSGTITGVPLTAGTYTANVTVTDASGASKTKALTINVYNSIVIPQPTVPNGVVLSSYTLDLSNGNADFGGRKPYSWAVVSGTLPTGLGLGSTGVISGIPTTSGVYSLVVRAQDPDGRSASVSITIQVLDKVQVTTTSLATWTAGQSGYLQQLDATGGLGAITWVVSSGSLPTGVTLNGTTGALSGTPSTVGSYTFTATASDSSTPTRLTGSKQLTILVKTPVIGLTQSIADAVKGTDYSATLSAAGGTTPYSWSVTTGITTLSSLGLLLDSSTGVLSGIPVATTAAPTAFTVRVTDTAGSFSDLPLSINVVGSLSITTSSLSSGTKGSAYTQTLVGSGGTQPYTWTISSGTLPAGLALGASTGVISGTPTAGGTSSIVVTLTDNAGRTATKTLTITIIDTGISGSLVFTDSTGTQLSNSMLLFGNVLKGTVSSLQVRLLNSSAQSVTITSASFSSSAFSAPLPINVTIPAGQSSAFAISFTPTVAQSYSGTLSVVDSTGSTSLLSIKGTGVTAIPTVANGSPATITSYSPLATSSPLLANNPGITVAYATQMQISTGGAASVTVSVSYDTALPADARFFKVINLKWTEISALVTISTDRKTITYTIPDNNPDYDADLVNTNTIVDPIVVGATSGASPTDGTNIAPASGGGGGGGCFIATAAYGSYLDPHVMVLRHFRDDVLLQSEMGTAFVRFYYKHSPPVADFIAQHDVLRMVVRFALTPLIFAVKYPLVVSAAIAVALYCLCFYYRRRQVRNVVELQVQ